MSEVLFSSVKYSAFEASQTLPAKFTRLLENTGLKDKVAGKNVAVKMHVGRGIGYTTISPLFVKILIDFLKKYGAKPFICDQTVSQAKTRGYTEELFGVPVLDVCGLLGEYYYEENVSYKTFTNVDVAGYIHDADFLINLSHVKGHGSCGYGGACKNIAMGCVTDRTRQQIHRLEGGITWDKDKCTHCQACIASCNHDANSFDGELYNVDYHHCTYCGHCVKVCPTNAIAIDQSGGYDYFQTGMALCTKTVLETLPSDSVYHINFLTNITIICDCWGLSTPSLVPDIGVMASSDIVSLERACLDAIKVEDLIDAGLPEGHELGLSGHLLERIHRKNPFIQLEKLEEYGLGTQEYSINEIK